MQAQEELLAGVARSASRRNPAEQPVAIEEVEEAIPAEDIEIYDRSMSPPLIDITKLSSDERDIDILVDKEDRQALVSHTKSNKIDLPHILYLVRTTPVCGCLSVRTQGRAARCRGTSK